MGGSLEPRKFVITDFDGDKRPDLVALARREVLVYLSREKDKDD